MKINKTVLKNGLRVVTVPMKDAATVTVMVMVEAGTRYETSENNGLSHFLEHMCFKGTQKRTARQIAFEIECMGAATNAFTDYNYTGYYIKGKSSDLEKIVDIVSDLYLNSTFPAEEIEKERGVICGEIDMYEDMPHRIVHDLFARSMYGDQPSGMPVIGPKENILRFTQKDFSDYHKKYYTAGATAVVVVGNIDHTKTVKLVTHLFKTMTDRSAIKKPSIKKTSGKKIVHKTKQTDQSHIVIGTRLVHGEHPDMPALIVASTILGSGFGSRLFIRLREQMGAGYYVNSSINVFGDASDITISTGTEPKRMDEVIDAIQYEVRRLWDEPLPAIDLDRAKQYLTGHMYMGLEATDQVAYLMGNNEILHMKLKTPKEMEREIKLVTAADIKRVAKKYFKKDNFHTVTIGPKKAA